MPQRAAAAGHRPKRDGDSEHEDKNPLTHDFTELAGPDTIPQSGAESQTVSGILDVRSFVVQRIRRQKRSGTCHK
jgi:hypothetical protein